MSGGWSDDALIELLGATADAIAVALADYRAEHPAGLRDRGERPGQYALDLATDAAARGVLDAAGVGVLSEESGLHGVERDVVVVVDPVDGSTNASRNIPWYAASLAAIDADGLRAAVVANLATGVRHQAVRGGGATRDGVRIRSSEVTEVTSSVLVLNGYAGAHGRWKQYRTMGAMALDLCAVADGTFDGSMDCTVDAINPWDYLGGALVLTEAGGHLVDIEGRDLVTLEPGARRTLVSAGTPELLETLRRTRRDLPSGRPAPASGSSDSGA